MGRLAPRMGWRDRQALVERFRKNPPKLVLMDWDNMFMDNSTSLNQPVTRDRVELLAALKEAGIQPGFVTNQDKLTITVVMVRLKL